MKKEYIRPEMYIVILEDDILQVITPGSPTDDFAKENDIAFDDWDWNSEEDDSDPYESLWDD